ncbi:MAG: hypothetical protein HeimC2_02400 [Candidatus Heimdallarchaeota archaeon LC_2]|nr:MAG: hypothetical protein HeimC2_02400 [Candidatus Heimdallarchaeota archaeon LC_2]
MGLGKVILAIFGILLILIALVAVDGYLTYKAFDDLSADETSDMVSDPQFEVSGDDSNIVTMSVLVDFPSAGFIPKGAEIKLIMNFSGNIQTKTQTVSLGDSKTLNFNFTMTTADTNTLATGGSLSVSAVAEITPTIFGYPISQAMQEVDLGSHAVDADIIT